MKIKKIGPKKKILLTSFLITLACILSITSVQAVATIIGSNYAENSYFRIEMDVYKENDIDPIADYYFVKLFIIDNYRTSNRKLDVQFVKIFCYTAGAEKRLSERKPAPGTYSSDQVITVTLFGVTIPIQIIAGTVSTSYWHATYGATQSLSWTYNGESGHQIAREMTYTLGYKVPEGNGLTVGAYVEGTWILYWWGWFSYGTTHKIGPVVSVSV